MNRLAGLIFGLFLFLGVFCLSWWRWGLELRGFIGVWIFSVWMGLDSGGSGGLCTQ